MPEQARVYYGELMQDYSVVGAPAGATPREFDQPEGGSEAAGQINNTYDGDGGVCRVAASLQNLDTGLRRVFLGRGDRAALAAGNLGRGGQADDVQEGKGRCRQSSTHPSIL